MNWRAHVQRLPELYMAEMQAMATDEFFQCGDPRFGKEYHQHLRGHIEESEWVRTHLHMTTRPQARRQIQSRKRHLQRLTASACPFLRQDAEWSDTEMLQSEYWLGRQCALDTLTEVLATRHVWWVVPYRN